MKTSEGNIKNFVTQNKVNISQDKLKELFNQRTQYENIIAKSQLPLVLFVSNSFSASTGVSYDEIFSAGMQGLTHAVHSYIPNDDATFTTFAKVCITNSINVHIKNCDNIIRQPKSNAFNRIIPQAYVFSNWINADGDNPLEENITAIEDDNIQVEDREDELINLIKETLHKKDYQDIVITRLGLGMDKSLTLEEAGNLVGQTKENIRQKYNKAIKKLKQNPLFVHKLKQILNVKEMLN